MLHDLDWEKWQDQSSCTVKTANFKEEGVNPQVAHAIETHNPTTTGSPQPEHKMEVRALACDELSGLDQRGYPYVSFAPAADLNLKSLRRSTTRRSPPAGTVTTLKEAPNSTAWS